MKLNQKIVEALQRGGYLAVGNEEIPEVLEIVRAVLREHKQERKNAKNRGE